MTAVVVDGCGAPQHALSVTGLAAACSVQAPEGSRDRSVADAMRAHPWLVAGTGREDTDLMTAIPGLLVKGGADGVHVAALPGRAPWRSSSTTAVTGADPGAQCRAAAAGRAGRGARSGCRRRSPVVTEWSARRAAAPLRR